MELKGLPHRLDAFRFVWKRYKVPGLFAIVPFAAGLDWQRREHGPAGTVRGFFEVQSFVDLSAGAGYGLTYFLGELAESV